MKRSRPALVLSALIAAVLTLPTDAAAPPDDDATIVHVLNRLGYGPRPGDVERVRRMGISAYIAEQLRPERLPDERLAARLSGFETLGLSTRTISERYEQPALRLRRERRQDAAGTPEAIPPRPGPMDPERRQANLPLQELSEQKVLRAVYSERQLQEVLVDFWFNHFNVDARKGPARYMLTEYERDAIRPHVLGRFRDLLGATAKSPAMLFYLDNWMSADPKGDLADRARRPNRRMNPSAPERAPLQRPNMPRGLNENYGRELLELHTLGVDAGYSQKDVTEVARAFTGWTIEDPRRGGGFRFVSALHDQGEKVVLGQRIAPGGGQQDGEEVLDLLAAHPATARFIAMKLARRFVSDTPPSSLVERVAATFTKTDGDIRAAMTVLLTSPEFLAPDVVRAKVKTPFDFVVSALRGLDADVVDARPLVRALQELGMPPYQCQPPTGYKDTADAWVNTGALVERMNVAQTLASGQLRAVRIGEMPAAERLIAGGISDATRATIARAANPSQAIALALGSPEFQRR